MENKTRIGFTLVEVIIIAVLAAISIPMYNGFVRDARQDSVDNLAQTAGPTHISRPATGIVFPCPFRA